MVPAAKYPDILWLFPTSILETDAGRIYSNDDIKQYIEEKYGFKVHSAYIGQVREKLGIREHENYNDSHTSPRKPTVCPEEKEAAIMDPLVHDDFLKVKEVLDTKPFAEVLRPRINQRFDEIWEKLRTSSDIAAIKNIKLESDTLKIKCLDEIDEYERAHQPLLNAASTDFLEQMVSPNIT